MPNMKKIAHPFWHPALKGAFILDWDGVLADTRLDFTALRQRYFGGKIVPLTEGAEAFPSPVREEILDVIRRVEMEGADKAKPVPGAHAFIAWLRDSGKPWAVVSRNCRESILLAAERCGIALPPILLSREDPAVKPEPEALFLAAQRLGAAPDDCVMVGDFVYDLLGARRASIRCVLVEQENTEWARLADAAYPTIRALLAALKTPSPLVPWEYRGLTAERGEGYLRAVNRCLWRLPERDALRPALRLARRGAAYLSVPEEARLRIEDWEGLDLPSRLIDRPLAEALREALVSRWPCVRVLTEPFPEPFTVPFTNSPLALTPIAVPDIPEPELDAFLAEASGNALSS